MIGLIIIFVSFAVITVIVLYAIRQAHKLRIAEMLSKLLEARDERTYLG